MKTPQSDGNFTHNFIQYKIIPKEIYKTHYKNISMSKPEEKNSIFRQFRNQKIINTFFSRLFGAYREDNRRKNIDMDKSNLFKTRAKTQPDTKRHPYSLRATRRIVQKQQTAKKVENFNLSLKKFHSSMSVNKNRIHILKKLNVTVKQFQSKLPADMGDETRQSIEQNQKLIKICIEDSLTKQQKQIFNERYRQIKDYYQPQVDLKMKKEFIRNKQKVKTKIRDQIKSKHMRAKTTYE